MKRVGPLTAEEARQREQRSDKDLNARSNCEDIGCPPDQKPFFCCKQTSCAAASGWFESDEIDKRFTEEQRSIIKKQWDAITGFLDDDGCRLAKIWRGLMSQKCRKTICYPRPARGL